MKTRTGKKFTVLKKEDKAFVDVLHQHFDEKKKTNHRYSIRAYAEHLDVDQSLLSKVLRGEKSLSPERKLRCLNTLKVPANRIGKSVMPSQSKKIFKPLDDDMFEVMSDWHHFAIMEFVTLDEVKVTPRSIAERFNISTEKSKEYLQRLINLEYLEKKSDDSYILTTPNNTWYHPTKTSKAKKQLQKSLLEESIKSIDSVPYELRDHSSVTIAINKSRMPEIKELLQDVRRKLSVLLQEEGDFDEVYQLNISLFPLTKIEGSV